jgi:hypothetical protein
MSGSGPKPTLLERKLTSASGSQVDLMPTGGHFGFDPKQTLEQATWRSPKSSTCVALNCDAG